ncbi:MAG: MerR family transcriptional regulator [Nannocystaceae bacterium]|nr:MerR family transcriptional regulator [Nannocystaceae bacterium]
MAANRYQVKALAELSGVTVRALHHYDAIGLLCPHQRTAAGYRLYTETDLLRLQQILIYRELGLPLEQIKAIITDPAFDPESALVEQRSRLAAHARQTQAMIRAVDAALDSLRGEKPMNANNIFEGFDPKRYEDEARANWGSSDAYKESSRRTKNYSSEDWARIKSESHDLMVRIAAHLTGGGKPSDTAAMDLAEEHRLQIDRFYYPCSLAMHRGLGQMYTGDARFEANLDKYGGGVAAFLAEAIAANADRG